MTRRILLASVLILLLIAYLRFVTMVGFQFELHGKALMAYFQSPTRALIFLIQFLGVGWLLVKCCGSAPLSTRGLLLGCVLLLLVSAARYVWPIFLVSTVGDLIAIRLVSAFDRGA